MCCKGDLDHGLPVRLLSSSSNISDCKSSFTIRPLFPTTASAFLSSGFANYSRALSLYNTNALKGEVVKMKQDYFPSCLAPFSAYFSTSRNSLLFLNKKVCCFHKFMPPTPQPPLFLQFNMTIHTWFRSSSFFLRTWKDIKAWLSLPL